MQLPRHHGEAETPTSNQSPRGAQGHRLLGPAALCACLFASLPGQAQARLGPRATVGVLGTGVPRLAFLWPAAWLSSGPVRPVFINPSSRPSRGAKPCGADDRKLPQRQPHPAGSRGGGEIKAGIPCEEPVTQAMTIETRRAPGGRRPVQCPCFPFGAKGASTGQGIRQRLPFRCNETKTSRTAGQRSPWSPRRRHRQCFWQPKTTFGQDNLY